MLSLLFSLFSASALTLILLISYLSYYRDHVQAVFSVISSTLLCIRNDHKWKKTKTIMYVLKYGSLEDLGNVLISKCSLKAFPDWTCIESPYFLLDVELESH